MRALRDVLEWCGVIVLALRVACLRLRRLVRGRDRVPA
jgi:hypothetical protein